MEWKRKPQLKEIGMRKFTRVRTQQGLRKSSLPSPDSHKGLPRG